ncbi:thioredoxin [Candidatus Woesearchaeota archaeon]|jgi:thioredoxin|nr:thioredoxin [Candidatus Woesearchaeota archaeon]
MDVTDNNFNEDVIEKSKELPVVVDFWAEWCHPCKMLGPVLEKLESEYDGDFILVKINVEQAPESSGKYSVTSIPAVKMFKNGEIIDEFTGSLPEASVKAWLDKNI